MLSYQHAYHAGNLADVHKHAVLAFALSYMASKPKPMTYIETHAGRGYYDLAGAEAIKTGEAAQGIAKAERWFAPDDPYRQAIDRARAEYGPTAYPGSPFIAETFLREDDVVHLAELHPQEHAALKLACPGAHVHKANGLDLALSVAPPQPARGLCLIDPSWEVKSEYRAIPDFIGKLARKWPVGCLMLWYPILGGTPHRPMLRDLESAHENAVRHEVTFPPARRADGSEHGMHGSGLFIVNPPYGFHNCAEALTAHFATLVPQPQNAAAGDTDDDDDDDGADDWDGGDDA